MNRVIIPKSQVKTCSKNCETRLNFIKPPLDIKYQTINNENDANKLNLNNKALLILKRSMYNEKIKKEALSKYANPKTLYRERSRRFNDSEKAKESNPYEKEKVLLNDDLLSDLDDNKPMHYGQSLDAACPRELDQEVVDAAATKCSFIVTNNNYYFHQLPQADDMPASLSSSCHLNPIRLNFEEDLDNKLLASFELTKASDHTLSFTTNKTFCYRRSQSILDISNYGREIMKCLYIDQQVHRKSKISRQFQNDFNKITEKMRAKMVDWMIEVLDNYKCDNNTFFLAVELLDAYLSCNNTKVIMPSDLHLIGCTCMFIASKVVDIKPLRLKAIEEKISHGKLTKVDIKSEEDNILKILKFNIVFPTIFEYSEIFVFELFINCKHEFQGINLGYECPCASCERHITEAQDSSQEFITPKKSKDSFLISFKSILLYLLKTVSHDYKIMLNLPSNIAAGCMNVTFKIVEQVLKENINENGLYPESAAQLLELADISQHELFSISQEILKLCQNFDSAFEGCENIKAYIKNFCK